MASPVQVIVQALDGNELTVDMEANNTVASVKAAISEMWALPSNSFRLMVGTSIVASDAELGSLLQEGRTPLLMQLVKFDPLPELGKFLISDHKGISVKNATQDGEVSTLVKTSDMPDSNNVLLSHHIQQPCFAEFEVARCSDEMAFGVAHNAEHVEKVSGFPNLHLTSTWTYARDGRQMPILLFGGRRQNADVRGFVQGDLVAVFTDPEKRQVKFYKNGELIADNLPGCPLKDEPLRMYAQVDYRGDEVRIVRFGPGEPY